MKNRDRSLTLLLSLHPQRNSGRHHRTEHTEGHVTEDFKKQPPYYILLLVPLCYSSSIKAKLLHYARNGKKGLALIDTEFFFTNSTYMKMILYIKPRKKQTTNNGLYASHF